MSARNVVRISALALTLSFGGWVWLAQEESYTPQAVIPTKGDVPTVGFGSTRHADGSPVQLGDKLDPVRAVRTSAAHLSRDEAALRKCVTAPVSQAEWDLLVDFAYQYGAPTACKSAMVRAINAGRYAEACEGYLLYRYAAGFDCSTPGNKRCAGVWTRSQARAQKCREAQ